MWTKTQIRKLYRSEIYRWHKKINTNKTILENRNLTTEKEKKYD